jgi:Spy/CpxP family protein refolding chaperone
MKKDMDLARRIRGDNQRDFREEVPRLMSAAPPSESQIREKAKVSKIKNQIVMNPYE